MGILHGHAISLPGLYFKESLIPGNWHMGVRCSDIFMGIALAEHGPQWTLHSLSTMLPKVINV